MNKTWHAKSLVILLATVGTAICGSAQERSSVVALGAELVKAGDGFQFTEGPAADRQGNVFFSDVRASRTYKWSPDGKITVWREDTGNANGQAFDQTGNLLACEGGHGRVVSVDPQGRVSVVADTYQRKRFNQPNDLWIDPQGGVYFSDPVYGRAEKFQSGEHVYYVNPDRRRVVSVIDDMVRPNGLVGTANGKTLARCQASSPISRVLDEPSRIFWLRVAVSRPRTPCRAYPSVLE